MKNLFINILNKTKNQPIDIGFFFLFLLTFSLSIRKVMLYFPIERTFNEYTGIYIYLSDCFLTLAIGSWLFILLCNKKIILSNYKLWITKFTHSLYLLLPSLLVLWSFFSILWSPNQAIALFRSIKLLEFYLLYIYIIFRIVPSFKDINCSTWNNFFKIIIFSALIQSCLGIAQFISQKSLNLTFLKESIIAPNVSGVAKIVLNGEKYIRAYGLFPHPNILGGFLVLSIILTFFYLKHFLALYLMKFKNVPHGTLGAKGMSIEHSQKQETDGSFLTEKLFYKKLWLIKAILLVQIAALFLTFSKSAILGFIIAFVYIMYKLFHPVKTFNVPPASPAGRRGTLKVNGAGVEQLNFLHSGTFQKFVKFKLARLLKTSYSRIIILLGLILIVLFWLIFKPDLNSLFLQSFKERLFYLNVPRGTISDNFFFGIGAGQFVLSAPLFYQKVILLWQYQPIHNVFLLIWAELGIIGFGLFVWLIWKLFHPVNFPNVPCGTFGTNRASKEQLKSKEKGEGKENDLSILNNKYNILSSLPPHQNILKNTNLDKLNADFWCGGKYTLIYFKGILLAFLFIMLFDHYFWDIQQGSLLLWMVMGFIAGIKEKW